MLADNQNWHNILSIWIYSWSLFQVKRDLPSSIINYGVSKHYAGSQVSDLCQLGYLFKFIFYFLTRLPKLKKNELAPQIPLKITSAPQLPEKK